jgi:hypothetical protein
MRCRDDSISSESTPWGEVEIAEPDPDFGFNAGGKSVN